MEPLGLLFAAVALVGWGTADPLIALVCRQVGNLRALLWSRFAALPLASLYLPFATPPDPRLLALTTGLSLVEVAGSIAFMRGLEVGTVALVGTLASGSTALGVLIALVVYREQLTALQGAAVALTIGGALLAAFDPRLLLRQSLGKTLRQGGAIYGLGAMALWGTYFGLLKGLVSALGWFWPAYALLWTVPILVLVGRWRGSSLAPPRLDRYFALLLLATVLGNGGLFSYNLGLERGQASLILPIVGAYPALLVIVAHFLFREPLLGTQRLGVAGTVLGVFALGATSV